MHFSYTNHIVVQNIYILAGREESSWLITEGRVGMIKRKKKKAEKHPQEKSWLLQNVFMEKNAHKHSEVTVGKHFRTEVVCGLAKVVKRFSLTRCCLLHVAPAIL